MKACIVHTSDFGDDFTCRFDIFKDDKGMEL